MRMKSPLDRHSPRLREATNLLKPMIVFFLLCPALPAQTIPHATGIAHTDQVDLAYETFGAKGVALPIIAINGGPGLSHAYMMQNDLWARVGKNRLSLYMTSAAPADPSAYNSAHSKLVSHNRWTRKSPTWTPCARLLVWEVCASGRTLIPGQIYKTRAE